MKKLISLAFAVVMFVCILSISSFAAYNGTLSYDIPKAAGAPLIDGTIDTVYEWKDALTLDFSNSNLTWVTTTGNIGASKIYVMWDDEALYIAADVRDTTKSGYQPGANDAMNAGDGLQLCFMNGTSNVVYWDFLPWTGTGDASTAGSYIHRIYNNTAQTTNVNMASVLNGSNYTMEVKLKWSDFATYASGYYGTIGNSGNEFVIEFIVMDTTASSSTTGLGVMTKKWGDATQTPKYTLKNTPAGTARIPDSNIVLSTVQVTLREDIQMDFTVAPLSSEYTDISVHVIDSTNTDYTCSEKSNHNGNTVTYVYSEISPQRADEPVTVYVTAKKNGVTYCSVSDFTYSLKQYCLDRLNTAGATASERTLLVDLLNYCQAAKEWDMSTEAASVYTPNNNPYNSSSVLNGGIGSNTGTSGHDTLSDITSTNYVLDADNVGTGEMLAFGNGNNGVAKWTKVTVSLTDVIAILFDCSGTPTGVNCNVKVGTAYCVPVSVTSMGTDVSLSGSNIDTITFNVNSYFYNVLSNESAYTTELVNLVKAMMRYGYSANQYSGYAVENVSDATNLG